MTPTRTSPARMHAGSADHRKAARWAEQLLSAREFVILDSETTGLKDPVNFVEIAIADPEGNALLNTTVRPKLPVESGAAKIHGYSAENLEGSPSFKEIYPDLLDAISGRRVVVYNAPYDRRVFDTEVGMLGARGMIAGKYMPAWECAMGWFAQYVGEPGKRGGYKSQKLPGGDHSALGDCIATLEVLGRMAQGS